MVAPTVRAYGTWTSPLDVDALGAAALRVGFPSPGESNTLYFTESRPCEQGRTVLVRRSATGTLEDVTPAPFNLRSRVHEYGGLSYLASGPRLFFVDAADQQIYQLSGTEAPRPLTFAPELRFAEPVLDPGRGRLLAVAERHRPGDEPENLLVSIDLESGKVRTLTSGRDFYAAPTLSPDKNLLAFLAWDHPHMPWDGAEVWLASLDGEGRIDGMKHVAGDRRGAAFQPTWSPRGTLHFSLEAGEFWELFRLVDGRVEQVVTLGAELGAPLWVLGTRVFDFLGPDSIVGTCFRAGLSEIVTIDTRARHAVLLSREFPHVSHLVCANGAVLLTLGRGTELVRLEPESGRAESLWSAHAGLLDPDDVSNYEPIRFPTGEGEWAHGFFYAPRNRHCLAPSGALPPLMVMVHGGPTACAVPSLSPSVQFWTTRGYAVFDVNYRGSTGYGKRYRERLRGQWGMADVEDCVAGARYLAETRRVDPERLVIRGGSAGGYTVLQALANHDLFAAGCCHYGVSDLEALLRDTHKFESRYDRFLVGPYPELRDEFVARSPIHYPERIRRPVAFFQGLDDPVVPAAQTSAMADSLRARGIDVEYHAYAGESHGFRKAETQRHVLETELAFLNRVLRLG